MTEQTNAQRLADSLASQWNQLDPVDPFRADIGAASDELRRLDAIEQERDQLRAQAASMEPGKYHVERRTNACADVCDSQGRAYATCAWTTDAHQRAELICTLLNGSAKVDASSPATAVDLLQAGLSNDDLRAGFENKLPGVTPTERELSIFALGAEVGAHELAAERQSKRMYFEERNSARDAWRRAANERDELRAALQASRRPQAQQVVTEGAGDALGIAAEALEEIALAGMSGTGQESDEAMTEWHARQAWKFIGIAARAKSAIAALATKEANHD